MEDPRGAVRVLALSKLLCQRGSKHGSKRLAISSVWRRMTRLRSLKIRMAVGINVGICAGGCTDVVTSG